MAPYIKSTFSGSEPINTLVRQSKQSEAQVPAISSASLMKTIAVVEND
jgi:hypothetical protein